MILDRIEEGRINKNSELKENERDSVSRRKTRVQSIVSPHVTGFLLVVFNTRFTSKCFMG
jgi:hypothetical protein